MLATASASAWKNSVNATIGGVGMFIGPWTLKSLNSIEKIQLRMMVLFTNPSARAGYDTRSSFKRSLTGLNSEFSFS